MSTADFKKGASAAFSFIFVILFICNLWVVIGNGYATASIAAVSKDLESAYKDMIDLKEKEANAQNRRNLAAADMEQDSTNLRRRELTVDDQLLAAATEDFAQKAGDFKQIVCAAIHQLQGTSVPTKWFLPSDFVGHDGVEARCKVPDAAPSKPAGTDPNAADKITADKGSGDAGADSAAVNGLGPDLVYRARQGASALLLLENYYFLPLFFGTMGAFLFCVRTAVADLRVLEGTRNVLTFMVRVILGGICGLIIGYFGISFAGGATATASVSASPLLFALAAGFSIETVVSTLERIATGKSPGPA